MALNTINKNILTIMKFSVILFLIISNFAIAQIPAGYYNGCGGSGNALKLKVHNVLKQNHASLGYASLWNSFYTTDVKPNGKLWDIYSFVFSGTQLYEFTLGTNQCGQYSAEGDCYNREHTWPQTYFGSADPMVCDLHQVFPTDGHVNGVHGNDPYGIVTNVNKTTLQGAKSGNSNSYSSWSNNVFEPIDSFKGDIARAYFYMNARYTTEDAGWGNWIMANGAELTSEAITLLLNWHHLDPVSQKEIDRNEEIFKIQGNRNAFIDHPEFADCIWGTATCVALTNKDVVKNSYSITSTMNELIVNSTSIDGEIQFEIYNLNGQLLIKNNLVGNKISIANLVEGMYYIKLNNSNNTYTYRFIK
jgi:endonuclease I